MIYTGDTHQFVLSLSLANGGDPDVTTPPSITVIRLRDDEIVATGGMTLIAGTKKIYKFSWTATGAEDGDYVAFVSYVSDGVTVEGRFIERVRIGDARLTGVVALDATCAKDGTVAKDATVAKATAVAAIPEMATKVANIETAVGRIPASPASETTLETLASLIADVKDAQLGTWVIDKTQNPKVLTFRRLDGSVLAQYQLTSDASAATRTKL